MFNNEGCIMSYLFEPQAPSTVAIADEEARFPVRRIFCVGRNYVAHAIEMGSDPDREPPFFFTKPADAVVDSGATIPYPPQTENLHYEAELVVAIGKAGFRIDQQDVPSHIYGYAIGNDLTRRDLQMAARETGRPWDWGKAFDLSAPCGPIHPIGKTGELLSGAIKLQVNGDTRQEADLSQLIWNVREIVSILSGSMHLKAGDLIYTGTPAGVGPVVTGDTMVVNIEGLGELVTTIGEPE
jgi:fumarylpyruvate hydrolase